MSSENRTPRNNRGASNRRFASRNNNEKLSRHSNGSSARRGGSSDYEGPRRNRRTSGLETSSNENSRYKRKSKPSNGRHNGHSPEVRRSGIKRIAIGVLAVLMALIAAAIGVIASDIGNRFSEIQATLDPDQLSINSDIEWEEIGEGYLLVALFGIDGGSDENGNGARSDSIMIASLNRETRDVRLVSIYRDTLMMMDGGFLDIAAHAYSFGGAQGAVSMLNRNLDLNIQHFVSVNYMAPAMVVDSLGGIEIDVDFSEIPWINNLSYEMNRDYGVAHSGAIVTSPGLQMLSGIQAVSYARIRKVGNDDFQRAERQREVLSQVAARASEADLRTINDIIDTTFEHIETNFTLTETLAYGSQVGQYTIVDQTGFPFNLAPMLLNRTGDTVVPTTLATNVTMLHEFLFGTQNYMPSSTVHTISNEISYYTATNELSTVDHEYEGWEFQELPGDDEWNMDNGYCQEPWEPDYPYDGSGGDSGYIGIPGDGDPGDGDPGAGGGVLGGNESRDTP